MTPWQVPSLIPIRIFINSRWFTFFLVRPQPAPDSDTIEEQFVHVRYVVDASAYSPATRGCPPPAAGEEPIIDCEGVGDCVEYALRGELAFEGADDVLTAHISHGKFALEHDLAVRCVHVT